MQFVKQHCSSAIVIDSGLAKRFHDIDVAVDVYAALCDEEAARNVGAYA